MQTQVVLNCGVSFSATTDFNNPVADAQSMTPTSSLSRWKLHNSKLLHTTDKDVLLDTSSVQSNIISNFMLQAIDTQAACLLLQSVPTDLLDAPELLLKLMMPFTMDMHQDGVSRAPRVSNPGSDGLPYPISSLLFAHHLTGAIAVNVFNDALMAGLFPFSWAETRL
ncbi:hypothetical protein BDB00DRAFT_880238 [Zychaea mexicana]|uniref:uncharacterized protein n=1 Tax=Zychaea mexicana TaxID=64656 RepID=UPI0022FE5FD4|nr:uncharacterized protein BDB00DRAFT_880238 [Zychaea mexicana]KAI9469301.1 hypothetical protein BDB00DRAFT_880238 [Zychaea mexicana]